MIAAIFTYSTLVALLVGLGAASAERLLAELRLPRRLAWLGAYGVALLLPVASLLVAVDEPPPTDAAAGLPAAELLTAYAAIDWDAELVALWAAATTVLLLFYLAS